MSSLYLTSDSTGSLLQLPLSQFIFSFLIFKRKFFLKDLFIFLHVSVVSACMSAHHIRAWCWQRSEETMEVPWHWSYRLLWTTVRVWSHPLEHVQPTSGHSPRETPPSEAVDSAAPQLAVPPALSWDVSGLILHRSSAGNTAAVHLWLQQPHHIQKSAFQNAKYDQFKCKHLISDIFMHYPFFLNLFGKGI